MSSTLLMGAGPTSGGGTAGLSFDSTNLSTLRTALASANSSPVRVLTVGDSITEGQGATDVNDRWATKFVGLLRTAYQTGITGGFGYVPSRYIAVSITSPVSTTGSTAPVGSTYFGLGNRHRRVTSTATETLAFTGTGVDIVCAKGSSAHQFTWAVDGGSTTVVDTNSGTTAQSASVTQIRGLSAAAHTVTITASANYTYCEGFVVYNGDESAGIRHYDSGHYAWRSTDFIQKDGTNDVWAYQDYGLVNPHLVTIALGTNDYGSGSAARVTPATMRTNLETLISEIRAKCSTTPSFVLWLPAFRADSPGGTFLAPWADYITALTALAQADGKVALFDAQAVMGDQSVNANGYTDADGIHPTPAGHLALANGLMSQLRL